MFLKFTHFYQQFIWGFSWIVVLLPFILWTKNGSTASKSISTGESIIEKVNIGNIVGKTGVVNKINTRHSKSRIEFLTLRAWLTFAKLGQVIDTALIWHNFDLKCHTEIKINSSTHTIAKIFSQLTFKSSN